jgi:nucleoside-triphosphatase THEP1
VLGFKIAVCGPHGSGKTTLVERICRLVETELPGFLALASLRQSGPLGFFKGSKMRYGWQIFLIERQTLWRP